MKNVQIKKNTKKLQLKNNRQKISTNWGEKTKRMGDRIIIKEKRK